MPATSTTLRGLIQALAHMKWFVAALTLSIASCSSADGGVAKCKSDEQIAHDADLALRKAKSRSEHGQSASVRIEDKDKTPAQLAQEAAERTYAPCPEDPPASNAPEIPQIN